MAGSMSQADLVEDLKRSLHDAASVFNAAADGDWKRLLTAAAQAMQVKRPRTKLGSFTLAADVDVYALASVPDFVQFKSSLWGLGMPRKPWEAGHPGALPRMRVEGQEGAWQLCFEPAPTCLHLAAHGSLFRFWYFAAHQVATVASDTTIAAADRSLLLLRAQAEAMRELTLRNVNKPVSVRDGFSGMPRNMTPAAMYQYLLKEWQEAR